MDIRKLQRAIVDGLEDVKAQDILVLNTEHLSALFERVIIASGTSNRQTKALASGVRAAVREAGFPVLATEGAENGEWIIVDCGAAVAHIMQPAIREYYRLEEIWGGKPVKMKLGSDAPRGLVKASEEVADDEVLVKKAPARAAKKAVAKKVPVKRAPAKKAVAKAAPVKLVSARKVAAKKVARRDVVKTTGAERAGGNAARAAAAVLKAVPAAKKTPSRKTAAGKTAASPGPKPRMIVVPPPARKTAAGKTAPGKAPPRGKAAPVARQAAPAGRLAVGQSPVGKSPVGKSVARSAARPAAKSGARPAAAPVSRPAAKRPPKRG